MTTQFVLIRHATCAQMAEVLFGRAIDSSLDAHGVHQAALLAERFVDHAIAPLIHASPRRRARETAAAIAARIGGDVQVSAEIDEVNFGRWAGSTFAALERDPEWRVWNERRAESSTPAGETITNVQARAMSFLHRLAANHASDSIAVVTHSEIIRGIVMHCLDISPNYYDRIAIDPASVTTIRLGEGAPRIEAVNERWAA